MSSTTEKNETVEVVRNTKAPASAVFAAFTDPAQLVRWIGPGGPAATRVRIQPDSGDGLRFRPADRLAPR